MDDDQIPEGVYFLNAPGCRTRREASAKWSRDHHFAEPKPLQDLPPDTSTVLHEIFHPHSWGDATDRLVVATADGKIHKAIRIGVSDLRSEKMMLDMIRANKPTVPVPRVYSYSTTQQFEVLVLEQIPGDTLEKIWPTLTDGERVDLMDEVIALVQELATLTSTEMQGGMGPGRERVKTGTKTVEEFYLSRLKAFIKDERAVKYVREKCAKLPSDDACTFFFAQADLDWSNIIIKDKRLSGLIDFECGGFYPRHWARLRVKYFARFTPWNFMLHHRMEEEFGDGSGWQQMQDLDKLIDACDKYVNMRLFPEDRREQRVTAWAMITDILGDDGRSPPNLPYDSKGHPWYLEEVVQSG